MRKREQERGGTFGEGLGKSSSSIVPLKQSLLRAWICICNRVQGPVFESLWLGLTLWFSPTLTRFVLPQPHPATTHSAIMGKFTNLRELLEGMGWNEKLKAAAVVFSRGNYLGVQ